VKKFQLGGPSDFFRQQHDFCFSGGLGVFVTYLSVWFILIRLCVCVCVGGLTLFLFFLFWKDPYWLAHQQFFGNIVGRAPNRSSTSLEPSCKIENKCAPLQFYLFSLYTWELNFGQTIWDHKTQVPLGTSSGMHLGTVWELNGNMLGTHWVWGKMKKKTKPSLPKIVCHYFCPMLKAGAEFWGQSVCVCVCVCVMHILYIKYAKGILKWEIMQQI